MTEQRTNHDPKDCICSCHGPEYRRTTRTKEHKTNTECQRALIEEANRDGYNEASSEDPR